MSRWFFLVTFGLAACSSSSTNEGGAGGAATGGAGGSTGGSGGNAGAGGSLTGGAGGSVTGGAGGSVTGGASGSGGGGGNDGGGQAGSGAVAGTGGASYVVGKAGSVYCGPTAAECPLVAGGKCCFDKSSGALTCQKSTAGCLTVELKCDSTNDCATGQVCCLQSALIGGKPFATCTAKASCQTLVSDGGIPSPPAYQLCDPSHVSPTECEYPANSTCKPATSSQGVPAEYFVCQT